MAMLPLTIFLVGNLPTYHIRSPAIDLKTLNTHHMYSNNIKRIFKSLIIAFFAFIATSANAQVKSYFGFFGGVSNPIGDFKRADYYNNNSGFAKKGLTYGLDGAWYF